MYTFVSLTLSHKRMQFIYRERNYALHSAWLQHVNNSNQKYCVAIGNIVFAISDLWPKISDHIREGGLSWQWPWREDYCTNLTMYFCTNSRQSLLSHKRKLRQSRSLTNIPKFATEKFPWKACCVSAVLSNSTICGLDVFDSILSPSLWANGWLCLVSIATNCNVRLLEQPSPVNPDRRCCIKPTASGDDIDGSQPFNRLCLCLLHCLCRRFFTLSRM